MRPRARPELPRPLASIVLALLCWGCARSATVAGHNEPNRVPPVEPAAQSANTGAQGPAYHWQQQTRSADFVNPPAALQDLAKPCPRFEASLMRAAQLVAERQATDSTALDNDERRFALHAAGSPHVWERWWSLLGTRIDERDAQRRLQAWLDTVDGQGELRCGLARARGARGEALVAVAVRAVADLQPVPTRARLGQWLDLRAQLLVPTEGAKVVLLGPGRTPRPVPTPSLHGQQLDTRVALDKPGAWLIQVLSVHDSGPRPALEAMVFVDSDPPPHFYHEATPGEQAGLADDDAASAMTSMLNAARAQSGLGPMQRDPRLDRLASEHARVMQQTRQLAHDLGRGGPAERLAQAGLVATVSGENLAYAQDAQSAHRFLWASPAHRTGMLEPRFDSLGVGIAEDENRSIWVCELYANFAAAGKIPRSR